MRFFLSKAPNGDLYVLARAKGAGEHEGMVGDFVQVVGPGEVFAGHAYASLIALGDGAHDIEPVPDSQTGGA